MKSLNQQSKVFAKKSLGQNFLIDDKIKARIIEACDLQPDETVIEIGPGKGALTKLLAPHVGQVIAIEKDRDLVPLLEEEFAGSNVKIIQGDFLRQDLSALPSDVKVIGNLPYNISTPILTRVIEHRDQFKALYMTVQWEFGARLVAKKGSKDYGSMTLFTQYYGEPKVLFKIPPRAFRPIPKVSSCFMCLDLSQDLLSVSSEKLLNQLIRQAFSQRRKRISNSLGVVALKEVLLTALEQAKIDPADRAENLDLNQFIALTDALKDK